jgi:pimeloyl-ACP methyl ester carboxylesterase
MDNVRKHGQPPFNIAIVHGGPGARGEMYPVALEISRDAGVLEPLQTSNSLEGQVAELKNIIENYSNYPLILIGFSWGAWLSYILTAYYPSLVKKLILISSGPFEGEYSDKIMETRLSRLGELERKEALNLLSTLNSNNPDDKGFARFGELMKQADSFDPLPRGPLISEEKPEVYIFHSVWTEANRLRSTGELLKLGESIRCPVVAIHGDYDPHPAEGVKKPLSAVLKNFHFILLKQCGHYPWLERKAKDDFYRTLRKEIGLDNGHIQL